MKLFSFLLLCVLTSGFANAQAGKQTVVNLKNTDVACGQCKFAMKGKGCNLAIRIDGKGYFVDNTNIDDHGDAHADDGFCNKIRKADVTGTIVKDRFVASKFTLLEEKKDKE